MFPAGSGFGWFPFRPVSTDLSWVSVSVSVLSSFGFGWFHFRLVSVSAGLSFWPISAEFRFRFWFRLVSFFGWFCFRLVSVLAVFSFDLSRPLLDGFRFRFWPVSVLTGFIFGWFRFRLV